MSQSILIVGAGPVGLAAAVELSRRGFQPRIVDAADGHPAESRALAIHARTLQILEAAGATEKFIERGNSVHSFEIAEYDSGQERALFQFDLSLAPPPYNFVVILPQAETECVLAEILAKRGIKIEWNTELVNLDVQNGMATVRLRGPEDEQELQPDIVIGADGAHSFVRHAIQATFHGERRANPFTLADVTLREPIDATMRIWFTPQGLIGRFPISDRVARYVAVDPALLEAPPGAENIVDRIWVSDFNISFRHVDTFQSGNVFLAGDAAHIHSPVGGRGMNLGIEDAAWLAWMIDEGRESEYTKQRLPVAKFTIRQTKAQTAQATNTGGMFRFLRRHVVPTALRIPPIRRVALRSIRALDTPAPPWL